MHPCAARLDGEDVVVGDAVNEETAAIGVKVLGPGLEVVQKHSACAVSTDIHTDVDVTFRAS